MSSSGLAGPASTLQAAALSRQTPSVKPIRTTALEATGGANGNSGTAALATTAPLQSWRSWRRGLRTGGNASREKATSMTRPTPAGTSARATSTSAETADSGAPGRTWLRPRTRSTMYPATAARRATSGSATAAADDLTSSGAAAGRRRLRRRASYGGNSGSAAGNDGPDRLDALRCAQPTRPRTARTAACSRDQQRRRRRLYVQLRVGRRRRRPWPPTRPRRRSARPGRRPRSANTGASAAAPVPVRPRA